mgnify:CR=1 FL=1
MSAENNNAAEQDAMAAEWAAALAERMRADLGVDATVPSYLATISI